MDRTVEILTASVFSFILAAIPVAFIRLAVGGDMSSGEWSIMIMLGVVYARLVYNRLMEE